MNAHRENGANGVIRDRLPTRDSKSRDVCRRSIVSSSNVKRPFTRDYKE
jgi:hypothetical protein